VSRAVRSFSGVYLWAECIGRWEDSAGRPGLLSSLSLFAAGAAPIDRRKTQRLEM